MLLLGLECSTDSASKGEDRQNDRQLAQLNADIEAEDARRAPRPDNLHLRKRPREAEAVNESARENESASKHALARTGLGRSRRVVPQIRRRSTDHRRGDERLHEHRRNSAETADSGQGEHERDAVGHRKRRQDADHRANGALPSDDSQQNRKEKKEMVEPATNMGETELKKVEEQVVFGAKEGMRWRRRSQHSRFVFRVGSILPPRRTNGELTLRVRRSEQIRLDANVERIDGKVCFE